MITQINNLATLNEYFHTETGTLYKTLSAKHECVEVIRCVCTLERISNWPLYKTRYYATHLINATSVNTFKYLYLKWKRLNGH